MAIIQAAHPTINQRARQHIPSVLGVQKAVTDAPL
jgi:hypothetical protein